jgi:hypothetical protein
MCELAAGIGMPTPDFAVDRWRTDLAGHPRLTTIERDLALAPAVAAALGDLAWGGAALRTRADSDTLGPRGIAGLRARLDGQPVAVNRSRRGARFAAAAAFTQYQHNAVPGAQAAATLDLIEAVADGTTRGQPDLTAVLERCTTCLADHLANLTEEPSP